MKIFGHLLCGGLLAGSLLFSGIASADYCNGQNLCRIDYYGNTYCQPDPYSCGYQNYQNNVGFYFSAPFFGGGHRFGGHNEFHEHGGNWGHGGGGGGGHHHR